MRFFSVFLFRALNFLMRTSPRLFSSRSYFWSKRAHQTKLFLRPRACFFESRANDIRWRAGVHRHLIEEFDRLIDYSRSIPVTSISRQLSYVQTLNRDSRVFRNTPARLKVLADTTKLALLVSASSLEILH